MEKKYRTEPDFETGLLKIIALKDFSDVKAGDKGGLIEKENNLSQEGDCWIYRNAKVFGNACVSGKAWVDGQARVFGSAWVGGNAKVYGKAKVCGDVKLWATRGLYIDNITTFIKDSKDYIILGTKGELRIFSSDIKNLIDKEISIVEENYIKNIKTIRQLYGKEV